MEPEVAKTLEEWFRDVAADMTAGLDRADRFDPTSRGIRCVPAFGQLEYLSQRWISTGSFRGPRNLPGDADGLLVPPALWRMSGRD